MMDTQKTLKKKLNGKKYTEITKSLTPRKFKYQNQSWKTTQIVFIGWQKFHFESYHIRKYSPDFTTNETALNSSNLEMTLEK